MHGFPQKLQPNFCQACENYYKDLICDFSFLLLCFHTQHVAKSLMIMSSQQASLWRKPNKFSSLAIWRLQEISGCWAHWCISPDGSRRGQALVLNHHHRWLQQEIFTWMNDGVWAIAADVNKDRFIQQTKSPAVQSKQACGMCSCQLTNCWG